MEYITCPNCGKEMTQKYYESHHKYQCKSQRIPTKFEKIVAEELDFIGISELIVEVLNKINLGFVAKDPLEQTKIRRIAEKLMEASRMALD